MLGVGASILLTGQAGATVGLAYKGAKGLAWAYSLGGPSAALGYCMNNIYYYCFGVNMLGYFPDDNGFDGPAQNITLQPGTIIQRFGGIKSDFVAPYYTDPLSLSLPYYQLPNMYNPNLYVVNEPLDVIAGKAAPWFSQYGGGTQYVLPEIIKKLLESGAISPVQGG